MRSAASNGSKAKNAQPSHLERFQGLLRELFQFDVADLDFGLYRLLHLKRGEIEAFLTEQLPGLVDKAFDSLAQEDEAFLRKRLADVTVEMKRQIAPDVIDVNAQVRPEYRISPVRVAKELVGQYDQVRQQLSIVEAAEARKADVFNHLFNFFHRYYEDGDFIPKPRYGARETYAVPYNGEEVFFHWANRDQHYVKSAEALKDYAFRLGTVQGEYRVRFALTEASVPKDNVKGDRRFFFPRADAVAFDPQTRELRIPFEYRPPTEQEVKRYAKTERAKDPDQDAILVEAVAGALKAVSDPTLQAALGADLRTEKDKEDEKPELPLLLKRLRHFARRQTTDYFIHKDLRGFLRRELEFYLKDQVLHIEDLEGDFESKRRMIRALQRVAEQVIEFLAQAEDSQKLLWEKKKFVLRTDYLIPIQHVPREFWADILGNQAQVAQWKDWFGLEPKKDLFNASAKVNEKFLDAHPTLVVDTRHFEPGWTRRLLEALPFPDLDEATDGLLIHSENYQALRLLTERYRREVECIYIDPPYNTGDSTILYKNDYLFSCWLALMANRLALCSRMLAEDPVLFVAIDDFEMVDLCELIDKRFPFMRREMIIVNHHPQGGKGKTLASTHEYMLACVSRASGRTLTGRAGTEGVEKRPYKRSGTAESNFRYARPNSFYAILVDPKTKAVVGAEPPPKAGEDYPKGNTDKGLARIYPLGNQNEERVWRRSYESCLPLIGKGKLLCTENTTIYQLIEAGERAAALFSNWIGARYNAGVYGANLLSDIIGKHNPFSYPKSLHTVEDAIFASGIDDGATCLDYFAGSGTTGHAIVSLNREDGENRRFILVEMGDYFHGVLLPRIAKVMFTPEWKDGKPARMATREEAERTPRVVKVLRLESYEDALHNLATDKGLERVEAQEKATKKLVGDDAYRLRYLLRLPIQAADTALNVARLEHPGDYTLEILTEAGPKQQAVDLIETFHWLYGLRVRKLATWVNPEDKSPRDKAGRVYRVTQATDREQKKRILVVWRDMAELRPEVERSFLEAQVKLMADKGETYDEMWINGDTAAGGFQSLDGEFKCRMMTGETETR